jgi:hypothetical protein
MPAPTKEDIAKLHSESNIYIGEGWKLVVAAISIVGGVLAWISQRANPLDHTTVDLVFLGCALLSLFMCLVSVIDTALDIMLATPAIFLRVSGASVWEQMLFNVREKLQQRISMKRAIYVGLGLLVSVWPFALSLTIGVQVSITPFVTVHSLAASGFFLGTLLLLPRYAASERRKIERVWREAFAAEDVSASDA